jgi:hypothetical protein
MSEENIPSENSKKEILRKLKHNPKLKTQSVN